MEKTAICCSVLVRPTVEPWVNLPAHATTANPVSDLLLVTTHELVEDGLSHGEPARLAVWGVLELIFCCGHHGKGPKHLIVISLILGLVRRHLNMVSELSR